MTRIEFAFAVVFGIPCAIQLFRIVMRSPSAYETPKDIHEMMELGLVLGALAGVLGFCVSTLAGDSLSNETRSFVLLRIALLPIILPVAKLGFVGWVECVLLCLQYVNVRRAK